MHAKIFVAFLLSALVANALPAKRDDNASASVHQSQASSILKVVQSEISAAGPSASAYTAFITTIGGRPVVEMAETVSGKVWVAVTSGEPLPTVAPVANAAAVPSDSASASGSSGSASATSAAADASSSAMSSMSMSSGAPSATGTKNAAVGQFSVSRPLLTSVAGALGAVGAGALMLL